jgi:hypothetical protein
MTTTRRWLIFAILSGTVALVYAQSNPTSFVTTQRFEDYVKAHERMHQLEAQSVVIAREGVAARLDSQGQVMTAQAREQFGILGGKVEKLEQDMAAHESADRTWLAAITLVLVLVQVVMYYVRNPRRGSR